jgi:hypothetical protein
MPMSWRLRATARYGPGAYPRRELVLARSGQKHPHQITRLSNVQRFLPLHRKLRIACKRHCLRVGNNWYNELPASPTAFSVLQVVTTKSAR